MDDYKSISFDDKNITYVKLPMGSYLIDGKIVNIRGYDNNLIQCKNPNDIRYVRETQYIKEYRSGDQTMSVQDYNKSIEALEAECYEKIDDNLQYKDLASEFKYRNFLNTWTEIRAIQQAISDPIQVEINHIVYDTKNPYIQSTFLNGDTYDDTLYDYRQTEAWPAIVKECFDSLGMEYVRRLEHEETANKKVWSNSDHSCIRFVRAFGAYIFTDHQFENPHTIRGTLEDVQNQYNKDKQKIESIIWEKYKIHFGCIDNNNFNFEELLGKLNIVEKKLFSVRPLKRSQNEYNACVRILHDAIEQIKVAFQE